jgi:hypothetical protein
MRRLSITYCLSEAARMYQQHFVALLLASVLSTILTLCSLFLLSGPLAGGWCLMLLRIVRGGPARLGELFGAFDKCLPLIGMWLVCLLFEIGGLALFIVPGVIISTLMSYIFLVAIDQRKGLLDALILSHNLVLDGGFGRHLLLGILSLVASFGTLLFPYLSLILQVFLDPLIGLTYVVAYHELTKPQFPPPPAMDDDVVVIPPIIPTIS